jgi:hypothetical protein
MASNCTIDNELKRLWKETGMVAGGGGSEYPEKPVRIVKSPCRDFNLEPLEYSTLTFNIITE